MRKGFHIDTALGGEQGLKAIAQNGPYAVIVSDLRMPGLDGIQFLSRVREMAPDRVREVFIEELAGSMILDEDVSTKGGTLLIAKGQEMSLLIRKRLKNFAETVGMKEPVRVLVPLHCGKWILLSSILF
ncbi:MAG: response regulator [Thermodesulfobacteriota bacterium]